MPVRFGAFEADFESGELRRRGRQLRLPEQSLRVLEALIERPGSPVSRDELRRLLWPDGTHVEFEDGLNAAVRRLRRALGEAAGRPRFVETLRGRGYRFIGTVRGQSGAQVSGRAPLKVAVLPFEGLDESSRWLGAGLTEELIDQLARCSFLRVIGRTSACALAGARLGAREVGRLLGVGCLVSGTARRSGRGLRVTVQLAETAEGMVRWSRIYDIAMESAPALHVTVARDLVAALRGRHALPLPHAGQVTAHGRAHRLYLEGVSQLHKLAPAHLEQSLELFEASARADPGYTPPLCGIVDACLTQLLFGLAVPTRARERAERALARALALDARSAAAIASRGALRFLLDWEWPSAEADLRRAVELGPGLAQPHTWYAFFLFLLRRWPEFERELAAARELDPLNPMLRGLQGFGHFWTRDDIAAQTALEEAIAREPYAFETHWPLGLLWLRRRDYGRAIHHLEQATRLAGDTAVVLADLGAALAWAGRESEARDVLETLRHAARPAPAAYALALLHTALGEHDEALAWLERGYEQRDPLMVYLGVEACDVMAPLRREPRFQSLLRRLGVDRTAAVASGAAAASAGSVLSGAAPDSG